MEQKKPLSSGRNNADRKEDAKKRKAIFLAAYEEWGTVKKACEITGIKRHTYFWWNQIDPEFSKDLDFMKQSFAESLEELALDRVRNPDKNRGSDLLLIGLLNANMPQKYRPQFAMTEDTAKDLIVEWRKAAKDIKKDAEEKPAELTGHVEDTLQEILERRGTAPLEKHEERQNSETEEEDTPKGSESR